MSKFRLLGAAASLLIAGGLGVPAAFAQTTPTYPGGTASTAPVATSSTAPGATSSTAAASTSSSSASLQQQLNFCVASGATAVPSMTLNYPGNNTDVVLQAGMSGIAATDTTSAGFYVFDANNQTHPVETVNLGNNHAPGFGTAVQFAYSSATPGPLTIRPFNSSPNQVCFTVTPLQLPSGVTAVTLTGATGTVPAGTTGAIGTGSASTTGPAPAGSSGISVSGSKMASIGQVLNFCLPANTSTAPAITFSYPGNSSDIVLQSSLSGTGLNSTNKSAAGFSVFDAANSTKPAEIATAANDEFGGNPNLIEFAYGSANIGQVQIRPFNATNSDVCFSVTPLQLPSGVSAINLS